MKKTIFSIVVAALLVATLAPIPGAETKVKAYHSGSVAYFNDQIVVATTNSGQLEIFKMKLGENFQKFVGFKSTNQRFGTEADFYDVVLRSEGGKLFAYAVDGRAFYKYDISDLRKATKINRVEDGGWDWFGSVTQIGGKIATVGSRGVKIWNNDLVVIDSYNIINRGDNTYNVTTAESEKFLFSFANGKISMFDREARGTLTTVPLSFKWGSDWYKRSMYNDKADDAVYVVDDEALRKINLNGEIIKSFRHTGTLGYDVMPSADGKHIYFSDGIGVVKLRKSDLAVVAYEYTNTIGLGGAWAMGLRIVQTDQGEKVVVFNNSSILVLNSNLKPVKAANGNLVSAAATAEETFPDITEPLFLSIDKNRAGVGTQVLLSGGGFGKQETLNIDFAGTVTTIEAGFDGRFSQILTVPTVTSGPVDIKVSGMSTGFRYNLGFRIE